MKRLPLFVALFSIAPCAGYLQAASSEEGIKPGDQREVVLDQSKRVLEQKPLADATIESLRDPFQQPFDNDREAVLLTFWTSLGATGSTVQESGYALATPSGAILVGHRGIVSREEKEYAVAVTQIDRLSATLACKGVSKTFPVAPILPRVEDVIELYWKSLRITGYIEVGKRPRLTTPDGLLDVGHKAVFTVAETPYTLTLTAISERLCTVKCGEVSKTFAWQRE